MQLLLVFFMPLWRFFFALSLAVQFMLHYRVELFSSPPLLPSSFFPLQFNRNRVNNKLSYATPNESKKKRIRMRLCNAYYEFLMHSIRKRRHRANERTNGRVTKSARKSNISWIIQCWVLFNRFCIKQMRVDEGVKWWKGTCERVTAPHKMQL